MTLLNIYLNFNGTTEEAFNFYKSVFGGEFHMISRFKDTPNAKDIPHEFHEKIMHVSIDIGGVMLMGTDAIEGIGHPCVMGTNMSLSLNPHSKEEATKLFNALAKDGNVTLPIQDMFWGAYFGSLTDQFGVQWMVNFDYTHSV